MIDKRECYRVTYRTSGDGVYRRTFSGTVATSESFIFFPTEQHDMALTVSRAQRLRTLENDIRKAAEEIQKNGLQIGRDLIEIRDQELWADEHESWNKYLKDRAAELVGKSFEQASRLLRAAEIAGKISHRGSGVDATTLQAQHFAEIARLAPSKGIESGKGGKEKDYSKLKPQDVARVIKTATAIAETKKPGASPSVQDVRKAVDKELGIDRQAKAAQTTEERNAGIELSDYLRQCLGRIEGNTVNLAKVPGESWKPLEESDPGLAERLAKACDELAELLRS